MKTPFKSLEFIYQDTEIHFLLGNEGNVMINATDMAKAFNKRVPDFLKLDQTKLYVEEFIKDDDFFNSLNGISRFEDSGKGISPFQNCETRKNQIVKVTKGGKNSGTWMHRKLALKLAAWLDPKFDYWLSSKIEILVFGNYEMHRQKIIDIQTTKQEIENLTKAVRNGELSNAIELLDKQELLHQLQKDKTNAIKKQSKAIIDNLFTIAGIDVMGNPIT